MLEILQIVVALLAALAVTILSIFQNITFFEVCSRLLITIPVFFVVGLFFRNYMRKILMPKVVPEPEPEKEIPLTDEELLEREMKSDIDGRNTEVGLDYDDEDFS